MSTTYSRVSTVNAWVEFIANGVTHPDTEAVVDWDVYSPSSFSVGVDSNGWIDVRPFDNLTVTVTSNDQDGDYVVEGKRGSNDPAPADIVASTTVLAGVTNNLYASTIAEYSHVRLLHVKNGVTAGSTTASLLVK